MGIDFLPLEMEVIFAADEVSKSVQIKLTDDDVFPEANKTFEVYLLASPGVYISPTGYASAIILNDDSPLPGLCVVHFTGIHCGTYICMCTAGLRNCSVSQTVAFISRDMYIPPKTSYQNIFYI